MADNEKWIEVFKIGSQTDSEGHTNEWTEEDLDKMVQQYNEQPEETRKIAPLRYGHETYSGEPAVGWIDSLKRIGGSLWALFTEMSQELIDLIKSGAYKFVSIGLEEDLMLNHIAILGAERPAVGGLKPLSEYFKSTDAKIFIKFSDPTATSITVEEAKAAQQERAKLYGIGVKDKIGYIEKPSAYKDIADEDFADPTNYLYPIDTLPNLLASMRVFNFWDGNYSEIERQVLLSRLLTKAQTLGIDIEPDKFYYTQPKRKTIKFEVLDELINLKQKERSSKFNIGIKSVGQRIKPKGYSELSDSDFGDPVNYRFPLTAKSIKSTLTYWGRDNIKSQYDDKEQEIISQRILNAAANHGINTNDKFLENKLGVTNMTQEQYDGFVSGLRTFLTDTFGEDVANQTVDYVDSLKADLMVTDPNAGSNNSEDSEPTIDFSEKEKALMARVEQLENENRQKDFKAYVDSLTEKEHKLDPTQFNRAMAVLEMGHKQGKVNFTEGENQKEISGVELVKNFMESYRPIDLNPITPPNKSKEFSEFNGVEGLDVDEERLEMDKKVREYQKNMEKEGKPVSYFTALKHIQMEG